MKQPNLRPMKLKRLDKTQAKYRRKDERVFTPN